jgi:hypothetical protein
MIAGASNGSNGWRYLTGALVSAAALTLSFGAGCGSSSGGATPAPEAGTTRPPGMLTQVTTGGSTTWGSSGGLTNPFGGSFVDAAEEGGATSDATVAVSVPDAGDASGDDGGEAGPPQLTCENYSPPTCGYGETCDLRYNTCCVSPNLTTRCVAKPEPCETSEDSVACLQSCECPGGQVCCGYYFELEQVVGSSCRAVAQGDFCQPHPQTNTQAAAQLCGTQAECTQSDCVSQTCEGVSFNICGLQSQDPFDCVANGDAGPP